MSTRVFDRDLSRHARRLADAIDRLLTGDALAIAYESFRASEKKSRARRDVIQTSIHKVHVTETLTRRGRVES